MLRRIIPLIFILSFINAQIALPTFHAVHKPHTTSSGTPENPLQSGGLSITQRSTSWNYMMGYIFTPNVNGTITHIGGYFDGTKTTRLWQYSNENLLASVSVPDPNYSWAYADITDVSVTAGTKYVVATAMNGTGSAYITISLPITYGNITINYTCYKSGNYDSDTFPPSWSTETETRWNYGLSDITFVPDE
jgi:hypothetical protein|tara:strand:- start:114 stop:689 length:576 start_codon:yes stop_codon:yes gene_type:complete